MLLNHEKVGNLIQGICQFSQMWNCGRFLDCTDTGKLLNAGVQKFVHALYQANLQTWNKKYNEADMIPDILPSAGHPFNKYQTLKTLQCLHYNIELEYVPEAKKVVEQLETMIREIMYILVTDTDEYRNAYWN
jgi:hypothetical protein